MIKERHRIQFFSKEDLACFPQLKESEELLECFQPNGIYSLNDLLEYYNIKLYFDNDLYLPDWSEEKRNKYKGIAKKAWTLLKKKIVDIDDNNIEQQLADLDYSYNENFWELLNQLNIYKKISNQKFEDILNKNNRQIRYILLQKGIVDKFDKQIKKFLLTYDETAELLLSKQEEKYTFDNSPLYYFPKSFSTIDKETIINNYLDSEGANLNYVRLIEKSKNNGDFKLSAKTRLKAKKKSADLNEQIMQTGYSWKAGVHVIFSKDQLEIVKYNRNDGILEATYSESFIDEVKGNQDLFNLFKNLFFYIDETNLIYLVSKHSELNVLELTLIKSKNEYEIGDVFFEKNLLSNLQLIIFDNYLSRNNNSIERLINSFVEYLSELIPPHKLIFKIQNSELSYLEKIRNLVPDYEFLLKQYKTFVEEDNIDMELIQIDSSPIRFSEMYSLSDRKYIYSDNNLISGLKHIFFSDQSHLFYTDKFKSKRYKNLYSLLISEEVKLEDFQNYQKPTIEKLIEDKYLKITHEGYVKLNNRIQMFMIGELYNNEVLSYWNYPKIMRDEIDKLIDGKLVKIENTIFSRQEKNYLNYYLNKKEFTNGFDLRNKYSHGTNSYSEDENKADYYKLLKIVILTLLKIEDDILIKLRCQNKN